MNCVAFARWLDEGRSESKGGFLLHARDCAACAAALRASMEIEAAFALPLEASSAAEAPAVAPGEARLGMRLETRLEARLEAGLETRMETRIDSTLDTGSAYPALSPGFTDRVMLRVRQARREGAAFDPLPQPSLLPWWIRAAAQPAVALASLVAALLLWRSQDLWFSASQLTLLWGDAGTRVSAPLHPFLSHFTDPWVVGGLMVPGAMAAFWVSWKLFAWSSRFFGTGHSLALTRR